MYIWLLTVRFPWVFHSEITSISKFKCNTTTLEYLLNDVASIMKSMQIFLPTIMLHHVAF